MKTRLGLASTAAVLVAAVIVFFMARRPRAEPLAMPAVEPQAADVELPKLFGTYLRYGALVCGPPAIDEEFKTIDFLVVLDANQLAPHVLKLFFNDFRASR